MLKSIIVTINLRLKNSVDEMLLYDVDTDVEDSIEALSCNRLF